jgi:outer membrane protein assembly factor BamA
MLSASLIQDHRDDPTNAHRGYYNTLDFGVADHTLGTSRCAEPLTLSPGAQNCTWEPMNFLRFLGRNSYYKAITHDLVLASNTEFGVVKPYGPRGGLDDFTYIPLAEHFFGGGSTSLRAFPENQAGPRDLATGFPLGGDALLFHSTELRFPFIGENIDGVLFHDFGNIYSSLRDISFRFHQRDLNDFNYTVHAAGFGIRYRTPVGPVRIDLAYSINPPRYNGLSDGTYQDLLNCTTLTAPSCKLKAQVRSVSKFQFFFSIGQAF